MAGGRGRASGSPGGSGHRRSRRARRDSSALRAPCRAASREWTTSSWSSGAVSDGSASSTAKTNASGTAGAPAPRAGQLPSMAPDSTTSVVFDRHRVGHRFGQRGRTARRSGRTVEDLDAVGARATRPFGADELLSERRNRSLHLERAGRPGRASRTRCPSVMPRSPIVDPATVVWLLMMTS